MKPIYDMSTDDILAELNNPNGRHRAIAKYVDHQIDCFNMHGETLPAWLNQAIDLINEIFPNPYADDREHFACASFMQGF